MIQISKHHAISPLNVLQLVARGSRVTRAFAHSMSPPSRRYGKSTYGDSMDMEKHRQGVSMRECAEKALLSAALRDVAVVERKFPDQAGPAFFLEVIADRAEATPHAGSRRMT
ncbi:MAG: hypothetical protein IPJ48_13835 [Propionivibrio sp.]|uniref:Uncharacterized protein n=1 Tax=Candidatus Propionivibrio dominans TaxID=2954373 RepID=A0A9D7F8P3_9RHOO|nr:hypothetical protein [Candidatus Propionivibrio dominans]